MSLDPDSLARALDAHGALIRVLVAGVKGSSPREAGAAMLVWQDGQEGTIGGGALEYEASATARDMLAKAEAQRASRHALGPDLGQCCGGAVVLFFEYWTADRLAELSGETFARKAEAGASDTPPDLPTDHTALVDGWITEPIAPDRQPVWIWGAGHVGRAIAATLAPIPTLAIIWLDTAPDRFPDEGPEHITRLPAPDLPAAMRLAPPDAHHLVLTYSHQFDLAICDAGLRHGFASLGLIGSATKWARFCTRLKQMGHSPAAIERIICPIGEKTLGKHPQSIAVGVAHTLLMELAKKEASGPSP